MRALGTLLVVVAATSLAGAVTPTGAARTGLALAPGDPAPDLTIQKIDGSGNYVPNWSGSELTVVNFWATFCQPCLAEMPALQAVQTTHKDRKVTVVGVLMDASSNENALRFAKDLGVSYTLLRGTTRASELWGGIGILPTTFLVNGQGRIVRRYVGGAPEQQKRLVDDIESLLGTTGTR